MMIDKLEFQSVIADVCSVRLLRRLNRQELSVIPALKLRGFLRHEIDSFVMEAVISFLALPDHHIYYDIRWPRDWWEAVKERWFPRWVLRRWPVQYNQRIVDEVKYGPVCHHLAVEPRKKHFEFLMSRGHEHKEPQSQPLDTSDPCLR